MTPGEDARGPYRVEKLSRPGYLTDLSVVHGPNGVVFGTIVPTAQEACDALNTAYAAGRAAALPSPEEVAKTAQALNVEQNALNLPWDECGSGWKKDMIRGATAWLEAVKAASARAALAPADAAGRKDGGR